MSSCLSTWPRDPYTPAAKRLQGVNVGTIPTPISNPQHQNIMITEAPTDAETTRTDPRYLPDCDPIPDEAVLFAWIFEGCMPMGCWADDDEESFRLAIIDQLRHDGLDYDPVTDHVYTDEELDAEITVVEVAEYFVDRLSEES